MSVMVHSKSVILHCKFVAQFSAFWSFCVVTVVLSLSCSNTYPSDLNDAFAICITAALLNVLEVRGLNVAHMVGFGSDGASVMTGKISGVGVLLKEHAKQMVQIHCMAHRLALVCVDAVKDNPYMQDYQTKLGQLYAFFSRSAVRCDKLEQIQEVLGDEKIRLKEPIAVRWLAMHNAVIAIQKTWQSLVVFFLQLIRVQEPQS
jgi:hypothetical protein